MANYYEILGIARGATGPEVRQAYARLAREKHPDRFPDPEQKARAQDEFQQITAAFNTLANERSRREYDENLDKPPERPMTPEEIGMTALARGLQALEAKSFHDAVEMLRTAVQYRPDDPRAHAALGRALARNPHWVREGIQSVEKAVQLAPRHAPFQADLAELLLGQGLKLRARKAAESALRLDPDNAAARHVLAQTEEPPPDAPPSGGLRGLLRRKP